MTLCILHDGDERPEAVVGLLCKRHRRRMDDDVTEIGLLIIDSQRIVDGGAPRDANLGGGKGAKKRADPPAPGDVTLMALYDSRTKAVRIAGSDADPLGDQSEPLPAVLAVVASWLLLLADERPLTATLPSSVLAQLSLIQRHHDWMAGQEWVDDYLAEMAELRKAMVAVVHDRRFERRGSCRLPFEDKVCGGTLLEENGTAVVYCTNCKARWVSDQELARLAVSLESA